VERYRQQLEKAREQPEAILVLEVTTGFVTEEIGESHQISSDFMVGCIIFHHFPNEWPLFFGRYTQFSDTHLGMDRWLSPSQERGQNLGFILYHAIGQTEC
jgi:hypothetical protein